MEHEQEQSNFLLGRKVTGNLAAWLGIIFCIALMPFIAYVYIGFELNLTLIIFAIVLNVLTTLIWLFGSIKDKRQLMLGALISWGTLLNIWLGYIFFMTIKVIPYGPYVYAKYSTAEIAIPSITVLYVFFYILLMLIYKSMDKYIQKIFNLDWQMSGILSGWLMIALTLGQTALFYSQRLQSDFYFYGAILYIVLNSVAAICWLYAMTKNKSMFALAALVCWVVTLSIWIGLIIYGITEKGYNPGTRKHGYNPIYSITVFYAFLYIAACYAFKSMRNDNGSESERFHVAYASPPITSRKLGV